MKKFLVVAFVLAAVCISTAAYAIEVTVNGEVDVRSRLFYNIAASPQPNSHLANTNMAYTEDRYLVAVNVKGDGFKGRLSVWNDHDTWAGRGQADTSSGGAARTGNKGIAGNTSTVFIREAWIDFMIPGTPVGVKAGRMNGMIGQGWFERSMYGGQEAWVVYANLGKVATITLQDVKIAEGSTSKDSDEADLYSLIATIKPADAVTLGLDVSYLRDNDGYVLAAAGAGGGGWLWNVGMNYNVKAGPATIKGQFDVQSGHVQSNGTGGVDYDGYQGIINASIKAADIVTINAGAAYGSGNRPGSSNRSEVIVLNDSSQHYSYIYEYRLRSASSGNTTNRMLQNTWFIVGGVMVQATKSLEVGFNTYYLQAAEWVALNGNTQQSKDLGVETDVIVNWKINPNLSWGWQLAWFSTGSAYRASAANGGAMSDCYAVQGVLSLKF